MLHLIGITHQMIIYNNIFLTKRGKWLLGLGNVFKAINQINILNYHSDLPDISYRDDIPEIKMDVFMIGMTILKIICRWKN